MEMSRKAWEHARIMGLRRPLLNDMYLSSLDASHAVAGRAGASAGFPSTSPSPNLPKPLSVVCYRSAHGSLGAMRGARRDRAVARSAPCKLALLR